MHKTNSQYLKIRHESIKEMLFKLYSHLNYLHSINNWCI